MRQTFILLAAILMICSCSSESKEGDWEKMKWSADTAVTKEKGVYMVSPDGETISFTCKNYKGPWISGAFLADGTTIYPDEGQFIKLDGEWFTASISGNKLTVVFSKNEEQDPRGCTLVVTAGDIFYTFKFSQPTISPVPLTSTLP